MGKRSKPNIKLIDMEMNKIRKDKASIADQRRMSPSELMAHNKALIAKNKVLRPELYGKFSDNEFKNDKYDNLTRMKKETWDYLFWYYKRELNTKNPFWINGLESAVEKIIRKKMCDLGLQCPDCSRLCFKENECQDDCRWYLTNDDEDYDSSYNNAEAVYHSTYNKWSKHFNHYSQTIVVPSGLSQKKDYQSSLKSEVTQKDILYIKKKSVEFARKYHLDQEKVYDIFLEKFLKCLTMYCGDRGAKFTTYLNAAFINACKDMKKNESPGKLSEVLYPPEEFDKYSTDYEDYE